MRDLDQFCQRFRIHPAILKEALGILPICPALTVSMAEKIYRKNNLYPSEEKRAARLKGTELSLSQAKMTDSVVEIKKIFKSAPDYRDTLDIIYIKWVSLCQTLEELEDALPYAIPESKGELLVIKKIYDLYQRKD